MDKNQILQILNKYNCWESPFWELWFIREYYLNSISESFWTKDLIKVLIWQRRVGKSYIIKQLISHLISKDSIKPRNILYINMEFNEYSFIRSEAELNDVIDVFLNNIEDKKQKKYIFIDEVQEINNWEKYINGLRANPNFDWEIIISWSNSKLLSWELATYLSWRYITFNISPFSYEEYLWITQKENNRSSLVDYLNIGWIPELYNLPNEELKLNYIDSLKNTIILKDVVARHKINDVDLFEKIVYFLIWNIGNLNSLNSIHRKLKSEWINISITTLWNYISYLEEIFMFHGVDRFDTKWKKILEWEKKYYLNDLSFINFGHLNIDKYLWKKLENFVFNQIFQKWYKVFVWTLNSNEIDFIIDKQWKKSYIQVCYSLSDDSVIGREYWNLQKIKDSFPKYVISMDDINLPVDNYWIQHIQAWNINDIL